MKLTIAPLLLCGCFLFTGIGTGIVRAQEPSDAPFPLPMDEHQTGMSHTPLGHSLAEVVALRQMLALHITFGDITRLLATLQDIKAAQNNLDSASQKVIDAERDTLLHDGPNDAASNDSAAQIQATVDAYRNSEEAAWLTLTAKIGADKEKGLRDMIEPRFKPSHYDPSAKTKDTHDSTDHYHSGFNSGPPPIHLHLSINDWIALLQAKQAAMPHGLR